MSNTRTPAQAEADDEPDVTIKWRTHEFTIPRDSNEWPIEVAEAWENGKTIGIVRGMLGEAQWAEFRVDGKTMRDAGELAEAMAVALGFATAGESPASSS